MDSFVSGLPGGFDRRQTLQGALKALEAGVKGYSKPATPQSQALTSRIIGERDDPNAGWHPVANQEELLDARLKRIPLIDTTGMQQLDFFAS